MSDGIEFTPEHGLAAARAWDDRRHEVETASRLIARAATSGFTASVSPAAGDFVRAWEGHATGAADDCDRLATALSEQVNDYDTTDAWVAGGLLDARDQLRSGGGAW